MSKGFLGFLIGSFLVLAVGRPAAAGSIFDGATLVFVEARANDVVYDRANDRVYATVPSSEGLPDGNAIVSYDPATASRVDSVFAGSEPNRIEVSDDGSVAYVGIDGANGFRSWTPGTSTFGPIVGLRSAFGDTARAENFAIQPGSPGTVGIARDQISSSADGDLAFFVDDAIVTGSLTRDANQLAFVDADTLITFNDSNTGFRLTRWSVAPDLSITQEDQVGGLVAGFSTTMEIDAGLIFASTGVVVDPDTLTALGTYTTGLSSAAVENAEGAGVTYFAGRQGSFGPTVVQAYDRSTFLPLDEASFDGLTGGVQEILETRDGLVLLLDDGRLGFLNGVPVPEPTAAGLVLIAVIASARRGRVG